MIKFKVNESERPVVDFDNSSLGIVVQAEPSDVRRWKMVMLQFQAVQEEMQGALTESLKVQEVVVPQAVPAPVVPPPLPVPPVIANGTSSKSQMPVEVPAFHKATATLVTQSVRVPEDPSTEETVAYNSAGYQGSGKIVMSPTEVPAPEMPHDGVTKRGVKK